MSASARRASFLAPEVIQTSAMDCGPAALKCVLEGFGIHASYGRLREACQTDVDGTSIDVMEEIAQRLGLHAEQVLVPLDHLLLAETNAWPAILVVRLPSGNTHFAVPWRRHGRRVQVMDPAVGRRWMLGDELLAMTHVHTMPAPAQAWRAWAGSPPFIGALRARLRTFGAAATGTELIECARHDPSWRSLATLDAATRLVATLVRARAVDAGPVASRLLRAAFEEAHAELSAGQVETSIPSLYWSACPLAPVDGQERVLLRGAVAVKVRRPAPEAAPLAPAEPMSRELAAALKEAPANPLRDLIRLLRVDGLVTPALVAGAALVASFGAGLETLVLRGLVDLGSHLATWWQRAAGMLALIVLLLCLLGVELPLAASTMRLGRQLETRLRMAFLAKIPRLDDRYFQTRPTSDMTHRAHAIHGVRQLPALGFRLFRSILQLLLTVAGLAWLDPSSSAGVALAALLSVAIPWATQSSLVERDLRVRAFHGSLTRFYLDALLGLIAVRTHAADRSLRREHELMLSEFYRAVRRLLSAAVAVDALDALLGVALAVWLLFHYLATAREPAAALLLVYWGLNVPAVGQEIAQAMRQYPALRNLTLRLLEPLGALEDAEPELGEECASAGAQAVGVEVQLVSVSVRAAGKTILEDVDLHVSAGEHVAIVGASGAGKSSLVGLLLGWHRAAQGQLLVNGATLGGERLARLRRDTAWVDPAIQIWNRSLLENVQYGSPEGTLALSAILESAGLISVLERLPKGLASSLGEGGALVSGGEGQRVRLARAMLRTSSRLVILDEPFRGLDRERRSALLRGARELWKQATLLCVTHDVGDTLEFSRVLVVDDGRIVEDGAPRELCERQGSRYATLLEAERAVRRGLWLDPTWRRLALRDGKLREVSPAGAA